MTTSMRCSGAVGQSKVLKSNILRVGGVGMARCHAHGSRAVRDLVSAALVLGARRYRWVLSGTERANAQPLRLLTSEDSRDSFLDWSAVFIPILVCAACLDAAGGFPFFGSSLRLLAPVVGRSLAPSGNPGR